MFYNLNTFLESPLILMCPVARSPICLYLFVIDQAMRSVLVLEKDKVNQHVYFVSKVFKGVKARYQKIERLSLEVMITTRKLRPYFQEHLVLVKTNYPHLIGLEEANSSKKGGILGS